MTVASEQLGFDDSFGAVVGTPGLTESGQGFTLSNSFKGEFTWWLYGVFPVPMVDPFVQFIIETNDPDTTIVVIQAWKRALRMATTHTLVLPAAASVPDPLVRTLQLSTHHDFSGWNYQASTDAVMSDRGATQVRDSGGSGSDTGLSFPTTGYFAPMLPLLSNLSPLADTDVTAVSQFINLTIGGWCAALARNCHCTAMSRPPYCTLLGWGVPHVRLQVLPQQHCCLLAVLERHPRAHLCECGPLQSDCL